MRCLGWHKALGAFASGPARCDAPCIAVYMPSPPVVSLRLPEHLARFVQEQAERQFRSRNSWVAELIAREYAASNGGQHK